MTRKIFTTIVAGALLSAGTLSAHALWVERQKGTANAYFGEWHEDLREKAGGMLDFIKAPKAFLGQDRAALTVTKETNSFVIPVKGAGDLRVVEDTLKVGVNKNTGVKTKSFYIAKYGRSETKPVLDLELVPDTADSNTFTLFLNGTPLPKINFRVFGPPRWEKSFATNEQGKVTIETPWAGPYLLEVEHMAKTPGGSGEGAYDQARYVFTLFFESNKGLPWKK